ncbi:MAG: hypothetical protein U0136_08965 [Bdellovibrionota bacterium]
MSRSQFTFVSCALAGALWIFTGGCTVRDAIQDLRPTSFIEHENLEKTDVTPFDLAWIAPNIGASQYETLIVEAVRTDYVDTSRWIYSASALLPSRAAYVDRLNELADYIQREVTERFKSYPEKAAQVSVKPLPAVQQWELEVEKLALPPPVPATPVELIDPGSRALRVQISIAEADFGDPVVYAGLLAVPVPGVANMSTAVKSPSLTLEARLVDEHSGEIKMELLDRRFPQVKIVDINRLTVSSALHEIADSFADDLVRSFYRKPGNVVGRRWPFSLVPW